MVKILIADDHAILRRGLNEFLSRAFKDSICGEVESTEQLLNEVQRQSWDIVILDVGMPGRSGLDALRELKHTVPHVPVLILSMYPEDQFGRRALEAGASGYLNKESAPEELIKAIRKILSGGRYVSPALAERLAADLVAGVQKVGHERLSDREFEVLRLIASGKTVSQIASLLHLSPATISTYRMRVLEKMEMATTAQLMYYALSNKLVA